MSDQESHRSVSDQGRTGQQARGDYSAAGRRFGPPDQDAPRDEVPTQNLVEADPRAPVISTIGAQRGASCLSNEGPEEHYEGDSESSGGERPSGARRARRESTNFDPYRCAMEYYQHNPSQWMRDFGSLGSRVLPSAAEARCESNQFRMFAVDWIAWSDLCSNRGPRLCTERAPLRTK